MADLQPGQNIRYYTDRGIQSNGLKEKLKKCKTNICECIKEFIENGINNPHGGLRARFARMLDGNAVQSGIASHAAEIDAVKRGVQEAKDLYDNNGCPSGGLPAETAEYLNKPIPTAADWERANGRPMPLGAQASSESWIDWKFWEQVTGLTGGALLTYLIISEGSRLFPLRNLVPIP
jgi:hypothetical protein